ncbi:MAG: UbiD family decarboxylase [Chloroflexi bacterium]|nr:UbiD family decarboxylase [Chloroflexota bacterium]
MMIRYYKDLRESIAALEESGKLFRINRTIDKDTELMPLVRWQFRGLPEDQRRAFLFGNITDSKGRRYDIPLVVGALGASREIYALGMRCEPEEIVERWMEAQLHPISPVLVNTGPVKEVVLIDKALNQDGGGLEMFPVPISTPGFDPAPYLTAGCWVTKDPDSGITNVGTYRGMIKGRAKTGVMVHPAQHIGIHFQKYRERGEAMPAAVVIGFVPAIGMTSVAKLPYEVSEYAVAGGIAREPIELVRCETIDLEVPATSEIVLEGEIPTDFLEPEAPFGEYTGYMGSRAHNPVFHLKAITHRRNPIYQAYISQMPPSESSKIRGISYEAVLYKLLRYDCNIPSVLEVAFHESSGSWEYCVIRMKKTNPSQPWQALNAAAALDPTIGKILIAVDEDIDPRDPDAVNWALSFRMQPHLDTRITTGKSSMLDPSAAPPGTPTEERRFPKPVGTSALLIDATRKHDFPAVSLPKKEFMEKAKQLWDSLGLPPLSPRAPWYGYTLGDWGPENEEEAQLALKGEHYRTSEKLARNPIRK